MPPPFPMRRIIFYAMYAEFWAKKMTMMLKVMEALLTIKTYPTTKHLQAPKFKINRKKLKTIWWWGLFNRLQLVHRNNLSRLIRRL